MRKKEADIRVIPRYLPLFCKKFLSLFVFRRLKIPNLPAVLPKHALVITVFTGGSFSGLGNQSVQNGFGVL